MNHDLELAVGHAGAAEQGVGAPDGVLVGAPVGAVVVGAAVGAPVGDALGAGVGVQPLTEAALERHNSVIWSETAESGAMTMERTPRDAAEASRRASWRPLGCPWRRRVLPLA